MNKQLQRDIELEKETPMSDLVTEMLELVDDFYDKDGRLIEPLRVKAGEISVLQRTLKVLEYKINNIPNKYKSLKISKQGKIRYDRMIKELKEKIFSDNTKINMKRNENELVLLHNDEVFDNRNLNYEESLLNEAIDICIEYLTEEEQKIFYIGFDE